MACQNNYIPEYVTEDVPWYERDGIITYIDQAKCRDLLRDLDSHFKKTKIVNFDIIHRQARGEKVPEELLKKYQTVQEKRTKQNPKEHKKIFWLLHSELTGPIFILKRILPMIILKANSIIIF